MEPTDLNSPEDRTLETLLQSHPPGPPLPDSGFSQRVLAALPSREPAFLTRRFWLCTLAAVAALAFSLGSRASALPTATDILSRTEKLTQTVGSLFTDPAQCVVLVVAATCVVFAFRNGKDSSVEECF